MMSVARAEVAFNRRLQAKYKFTWDGTTHYVVEDTPDSDVVWVRFCHGEYLMPKDILQELIENEVIDISHD